MGIFLNDPVGHGIELIEAGAEMGVEIQHPVFAAPELLHAGKALKNKAHVALERGVQVVEGFHEAAMVPGVVQEGNGAGEPAGAVFIEFQEDLGPGPFAVGKAIQNGHLGVIRQGTELVQEIFGGTVEAHIDEGLFQGLGNLDEI